MSRSCRFAKSQMDAMHGRVNGTLSVSNKRVFPTLALALTLARGHPSCRETRSQQEQEQDERMIADDEIVYLDNNATTPLDPAVIEEMLPFLMEHYGNPSSGYVFAARARKALDLARERLAALLGCEPSEIVFTSGGTESNNAVINSALQSYPRGKHVVTSAVEHSAVLGPCQDLTERGCEVTFV